MKGMQILLKGGIVARVLDYTPAKPAIGLDQPEPSEVIVEFRNTGTDEVITVEDDSPLWDTVREICDEEYLNEEYAALANNEED